MDGNVRNLLLALVVYPSNFSTCFEAFVDGSMNCIIFSGVKCLSAIASILFGAQ